MALEFFDSFDHYQTAQRTAKWTSDEELSQNVIAAGEGRCGSNALRVQTNSFLAKGVTFGNAEGIVGFAIRITALTTSVAQGGRFTIGGFGTSSGDNVILQWSKDGKLHVYRDEIFPVLLGSSVADTVKMNEWFYVEFRALIHASAGQVEVHVNGVQVINVAGIDTVSDGGVTAEITKWTFLTSAGGGTSYYVDDFYILDTTGGAPQNTFLGDVHAEYLSPTAPGADQDWSVVGVGTHWQAVNDGSSPDDDTTYIQSSTANQSDTEVYANTGLPAGGTIFGVQVGLYTRKTDSGLRAVAPIVRHAGVDQVGTPQNPSFGSYVYLLQLYETNPGTGAAWTIAGVNDAEFGIKVTT